MYISVYFSSLWNLLIVRTFLFHIAHPSDVPSGNNIKSCKFCSSNQQNSLSVSLFVNGNVKALRLSITSAHFTSTFQYCIGEFVSVALTKASSYLQSPQSQQTSEGSGLHRTYQIVLQVPGNMRKEKLVTFCLRESILRTLKTS